MTTPFVQLFQEVWRSIGLELVIFAVTLICAFAVRRFSPSPGAKSVSQKACDLPKSSAQPKRCEATKHRLPTEPAEVLREVMQCLQEQNSAPRPPSRILGLYSELRHLLRSTGQTMAEVAAESGQRAADLYSGLTQLAIRSGKHQMLNSIIDDMVQSEVPRSLAFYESVMKQLAVQRQFRLALRVYDRLVEDGLETTAITCSCLVRFAAEVGDFTRAREFFEKLSSMTTPSIRAYMTILGVHNKRQDWPSALATIRDMRSRGVSVDSLALNVTLSTGVAADKVDEVLDLLTEAEQMKPSVADVVSYNTLIKAFTQRANYDAACEVMQRMKARRISPNAISFNTIMDAAVRAGRPEEAWSRQQEMRQHGYKPDKFTCSILVKAFCKAGVSTKEETVGRAISLLDEADDCLDANLKATLYNNVLEAATKADMSASVLKVMQQMRHRRVSTAQTHQKSIASALLDESGQ